MSTSEYTLKDIERFWSHVDKSGGDDACWIWTAGRRRRGYGSYSWHRKPQIAHRVAWMLTNGAIPDGLLVCHDCPDGKDNPSCVNPAHLWLGTNAENSADMVRKGRAATGKLNGKYTHPERTPRGERSGSFTHPEQRPKGERHWTHIHPEKLARGERNGAYTHPETRAKGDRHGTYTHPEKRQHGENHKSAKLTDAQVAEIRRLFAIGNVTKTTLARQFGVGKSHIGRILSGESRRT